jgi:uncharacterized protein YegP (UPF0339 family)
MGKFVIKKGKNNQYYFNLKARNGEKIFSSEGYTSKQACQNGIDSVKLNAPLNHQYEKLKSGNGEYYFVLKSANGQIIGTSEMYETVSGRDNGMVSVKANAPTAPVVEEQIVEDL